MGFHEWLIRRSYKYAPNDELGNWLETWQKASDRSAKKWAKILRVKEPVKKRAIAPNGCQNPNTLILSDEGILKLSEVVSSTDKKWENIDLLVSQENDFAKSTKFYNNGVAKTKTLKLSSGTELESTFNHKYRV